MQKQIAVVLVAILFIVVGLCGCNGLGQSSEESRFVGTWKPPGTNYASTYTFFSDGTCTVLFGMSGVYNIKDGKLVIDIDYEPLTLAYDYYFSDDDTKLTLISVSDENEIDLIKQ